MTKMVRDELVNRFRAMSVEEKRTALSCMDDDLILEELAIRLRIPHLLTDKVAEMRRVVSERG